MINLIHFIVCMFRFTKTPIKVKRLKEMNIKERMEKQVEKLIEITIKSYQECADHYPKHMKIVEKLCSIFMDIVLFNKHDLMKFYEYLDGFSNFIAKKYFPDEINKLWRRPIVLEKEVINYFHWEKDNLWNNEKKTIFDESIKGFLEIHGLKPETYLNEEYYNAEQTARVLGISIEELNKFTEEHQEELKGNILKLKKRKNGYSIVFDGEDLELNIEEGIQEIKKEKEIKRSNLKYWF